MGWGEGGFARVSMEVVEMNATCGLLVESVAPLKYSNETDADSKFDPILDDYVDLGAEYKVWTRMAAQRGRYSHFSRRFDG